MTRLPSGCIDGPLYCYTHIDLTLYFIDTHLTHQQQIAFENTMGKGEITRNEQFLLFPQCFLLIQIIESPFGHIFDIISLFAADLEKRKIAISGKGLRRVAVSEKWSLKAGLSIQVVSNTGLTGFEMFYRSYHSGILQKYMKILH